MEEQRPPKVELHVWPGRWGLPSLDLHCLITASVLQLHLPAQFTLVEGADLGTSPGTRLPFLRHGLEQTPTHSKILRYISNIPRTDSISISRPDSRLSKDDHASLVALTAFVNSDLSDLVNHSLFSLPLNWLAEVRPAYASNLPIPQRYYLPSKKRTEVRDRLEREGLWGLGGDAEVEEEREKGKKEFLTDHSDLRVMDRIKKAEQKDQIKREFDKQKVVRVARDVFRILSSKLGDQPFFFGGRPTSLDATVFAHLALLIYPTLPQPILSLLLSAEFRNLETHTHRMLYFMWPPSPSSPAPLPHPLPPRPEILSRLQPIPWPIRRLPASPTTLEFVWTAISSLPVALYEASPLSGVLSGGERTEKKERSTSEKKFHRHRMLWFGGVGIALGIFAVANGMVQVPALGWAGDDERGAGDEEGEEGEDEEEEEEEDEASGEDQ